MAGAKCIAGVEPQSKAALCYTVTSSFTESASKVSGLLGLSPVRGQRCQGIYGSLGGSAAGHFLWPALSGGWMGVEQQHVDHEQRLTCALPTAKLVFPNYNPNSDF